MEVIVVASVKGGVGKTTTAVSVAAALWLHQPTLLMDFDPQGQVALWFGHDPRSGVFDWWVEGKTLEQCTVPARDYGHLWLLPGDSRTRALEKLYRDLDLTKYTELVERIRALRDNFGYVVIDTSPGGVLQEIALGAADQVIVPFKAEAPGIDGAYGTLAMLEALPHHATVTLLAVDYYAQVIEQKRSLQEFMEAQGAAHFAPRPVPHRIAVAEAVAEGKTIWDYPSRALDPVRVAYTELLEKLYPTLTEIPFREELCREIA